MILYHLTLDLNHDGNFELRHSEYEDERDYTKLGKSLNGRICFSDSLKGCLGSMSSINKDMEEGAEPVTIKIFELHVNDEIAKHLITPKELTESELVWDAEIHGEYWLTQPIKIDKEYSFEFTLAGLDYEYVRIGSSIFDTSTCKVTEITTILDNKLVTI